MQIPLFHFKALSALRYMTACTFSLFGVHGCFFLLLGCLILQLQEINFFFYKNNKSRLKKKQKTNLALNI